MPDTVKCPSCKKLIEADSAFCRYCGHQLTGQTDDKQSVLNKTADFSDLGEALTAINTFFERWPDPDSPEARDVSFTRHCLLLIVNMVQIVQDKYEPNYENLLRLANASADGLPQLLSNGLATTARVINHEKEVTDSLSSARDICAAFLTSLYDAAEKECDTLFVEGKSQAQIQKLTMEDVYADAEVHYASFQNGELDAARRGFTHLKELNPEDAYFRNCLGSVLFQQDEVVPALQEYLFGLSRDPVNDNLLSNTLRCLCGLALFPAAVELVRHCEKAGADLDSAIVAPWVSLARAISSAVATSLCKCTPDDFSSTATDSNDEVGLAERPWLRMPKTSTNTGNVLHDARIFISYRHAGGMNHAQRLERGLKGAYPGMHVFRDETLMVPGIDFIDQIREEIDQADVFLALVDETWVQGGKQSRLQDRKDILRRELSRAFEKNIAVVPVLLDSAPMPEGKAFPAELREFVQLHAVGLSEDNFNTDLGMLQAALTRLITEKRLRQKLMDQEFDELSKLDETDPEGVEARWDDMFKPAIDDLAKYYPMVAAPGQGVKLSRVELQGMWDCEATGADAQTKLHFVTEGTSGTPFSGEIVYSQRGLFGLREGKPEPIKGTWMPVIDQEKDLLHGIFLDGLKSGLPFKVIIPFHRQVGHDLVGTDAQGVTYCSRNIEPKRKGF